MIYEGLAGVARTCAVNKLIPKRETSVQKQPHRRVGGYNRLAFGLQREHSTASPKHLGYELLEMADFSLHLHQSCVPDRKESKCSASLTHEEQKWSTSPIPSSHTRAI
jgi:hypothetical protein